ncbi:MAG TPA: secondary thiamine-phosphate synthase enzyme YjbQ [Chthoniobacterales bacterium]|nr:secondary thiamine-phosphate synthase enzyme YjbQ [Chthoniobacterales bacterium]
MLTAFSYEFSISTHGIGTYEITDQINRLVVKSRIKTGVATILIQHTSASLILFENADPSARADLENFLRRLVPENSAYFTHTLEGPDDMPSHVRMVLTRSSESIPIADGKLQLGTWQGLFVYEHRHDPMQRRLSVSVIGESG